MKNPHSIFFTSLLILLVVAFFSQLHQMLQVRYSYFIRHADESSSKQMANQGEMIPTTF